MVMIKYIKDLTIIKILRNSLQKEPLRPLGRWRLGENDVIKSFYANSDNCGDKICGDPLILQKNYPKMLKNR
jgi:hypothetical protein